MAARVYIDGHVGTTGLRIRDWLAGRADLEVVSLLESERKDAAARRALLLAADLAILCLPDDASREAAEWAMAGKVRIIDASTAHRVAPGWVFGLPELCPEQRQQIRDARFVSNPGCYSTATILLLRPLVDAGIIAADAPLAIHALSGYSGGGRALIERWENPSDQLLSLPFEAPYALDRVHKHVPEMTLYSGLARPPLFVPAVGPFRCGMRVEIPLPAALLRGKGAGDCRDVLAARYRGETFVQVLATIEEALAERSLDPRACNDTNRIDLQVAAHPDGHVLLVAILDNLGKGAAGAAIQSLNLMLGLSETAGLVRALKP